MSIIRCVFICILHDDCLFKFPLFSHEFFVVFLLFSKSFLSPAMYKEVVVSSSLKENTINIWDVNSCTNIFEFKENNGVKHGMDISWNLIIRLRHCSLS